MYSSDIFQGGRETIINHKVIFISEKMVILFGGIFFSSIYLKTKEFEVLFSNCRGFNFNHFVKNNIVQNISQINYTYKISLWLIHIFEQVI